MIKLFVSVANKGHPNFLMALTSLLVATYTLAVQESNTLLSCSDFEAPPVRLIQSICEMS